MPPAPPPTGDASPAPTVRLYLDDPSLLEFDAVVVARRDDRGRTAVVLDRTAFYAESGGQPWDTGTLNGVPVLEVVEEGSSIVHRLGGELAGGDQVHGVVDAGRRRDHMQQHHGQHLLSRAFVDVAGARTVSFHLGADEVSIDLHREVSPEHMRAAEARANAVVREARPVRCRIVTPEEARLAGVEPPPDAGRAIRLVEAEGYDLQPCGGTHPRTTAEVGVIALLAAERYKSGSRIRFVCGERATRAWHARNEVLSRIGALLSAPFDGIPEAVERLLAQLADAERRSAELLERSIDAEVERLLRGSASSPAVVVASFDGRPPEELRALAQCLAARAPCVVLLGSRADKAHLVFAQSDGLPHDIPALLREAAGVVGGRGGGKGNIAQGGGDRLDALDAALRQAERRIREV